MNISSENALLAVSAFSCCLLGIIVIYQNHWKRTHRLFAVLALNLMLWALGVLLIINSDTPGEAEFWIRATFVVASFLPATFYHFILCFPHQRAEGNVSVLGVLYVGAAAQVAGTFSPWYLHEVIVEPGRFPAPEYGFVFRAYAVWVLLSMAFSFTNLFQKLRHASGVERRQIEHVLVGIFLCTTLAASTNVLAPALNIRSLEVYGPAFPVLLMLIMAYAMVRYHLMDIWVLLSKTTIYAVVTMFVIAVFLGMVTGVHWVFSHNSRMGDFMTTLLAALVIALVLQPLKEYLQRVVERGILKRGYDVRTFCARVTRYTAQFVHLDELMATISEEIRSTIGIRHVRLWLVDEKDPDTLQLEFTNISGERRGASGQHVTLLRFLRDHPDPIVLKKLLHERPNEWRVTIARHLAELEAYMCIPLTAGPGLVGVMALGEKISGDMFTVDDLLVFNTIAGPLGTAIEGARLYRKLEEVNMHLERILFNMRGGVVAVDNYGVVTTCNEAATEIMGPVKPGQAMQTLPPEIAEVLRSTLTETRTVAEFETVVKGPDGEDIPVMISGSSIRTRDDAPLGAIVMVQNLVQLKRLEQNVQRADRMSSIGTLAAGMAHEVKNPLVSIKTFTQLLLTKFDDVDFRETFAEVVPHEVDRIDTTVRGLLDFARPRPVEFAEQDLADTIRRVLALVENQARKANIGVRLEAPEEKMRVYGDEQQLHQLFLNLFLNAIDAMKEGGGDLSVNVRRDRAMLRKKGSAYMEVPCVRVAVRDTGCGIEQKDLDQIFTPFFTTKAEGSGLGLAVVHGIVTEHGGEIDVESVCGSGTSFTVTFPLLRVDTRRSGLVPLSGPAIRNAIS